MKHRTIPNFNCCYDWSGTRFGGKTVSDKERFWSLINQMPNNHYEILLQISQEAPFPEKHLRIGGCQGVLEDVTKMSGVCHQISNVKWDNTKNIRRTRRRKMHYIGDANSRRWIQPGKNWNVCFIKTILCLLVSCFLSKNTHYFPSRNPVSVSTLWLRGQTQG